MLIMYYHNNVHIHWIINVRYSVIVNVVILPLCMLTCIAAAPPRPTRPPAIKSPVHKAVVAKATPSKPSSEPDATRLCEQIVCNNTRNLYLYYNTCCHFICICSHM